MAERWLLYIDESGEFEEGQLDSLVLGVLVRGVEPATFKDRLRERLAQLFPNVPYPPHAAHLNLTASRPWYAMRHQPMAPLDPAVAAARDFLAKATHRDARALQAKARSAGEATWDELRRASDLLAREAPQIHPSLAALHLAESARFRDFCREDLQIVAAVAPREHDAAAESIAPPALRHDRYVATMETLLERVVALLGPHGDERVEVHVRIAGRNVHEDLYGPRVPLAPRHVAATASRVTAQSRVTFFLPADYVAARVERYDEHVHPGLVLADHYANSLRRRLLQTPCRGWPRVVRSCHDSLGIDLNFPARDFAPARMPGVAAAGPARAYVRGLRAELTAHAEPRQWARDQASIWRDAVPAGGRP
jgi:hypothetical protein